MDTPVPLPNTEVKHLNADGTWVVTPWESRKLPGYINYIRSSITLDRSRASLHIILTPRPIIIIELFFVVILFYFWLSF